MSMGRYQVVLLRSALLAAAVVPVLSSMNAARADDVSPAPILQYFESTYSTLEDRMGDVFKAGYGMVYTPPPGRADSGGQSVGYDQYNRFDLGSAENPTLYGPETGLKAAVSAAHAAGLDYGVDFVMNHNGYSGTGGDIGAFNAAGAYPGFVSSWPGTSDGDYHSAFAGGDIAGRLAGLIDIDHTQNIQVIRQPTQVDSRNIPTAGTPNNPIDPNNARFYTDLSGKSGVKFVYDPKTGEQNIAIYNFATNPANISVNNAAPENAMGYLQRNAEWLVQSIGVDDFRLDATKNMDSFVLNYFDRAVYRASTRTLLDGSQKQIFSWGEYYDGNTSALLSKVRKDINPADPGTIGGNRDTLDFPLFFAIKSNFSNNGLNNSWFNVVHSSLDLADDGKMNGSVGVKFAGSHDDGEPDLGNVANAYTMMLPGNVIVYDNAKEFNQKFGNRDFPRGGRADALGGAYGDAMTKLVNIRNVYAQGNYVERYVSKESYAFERDKQSITLMSNRSDNVYDNQRIYNNFAYGEHLVELTGNAAKYGAPQVLQVTNDFFNGPSYVNASFLANNGGDHGYLVYGLQAPQGTLNIGGVAQTLPGAGSNGPVLSGTQNQQLYQNATTRLTDIQVIKGNSFSANMNTVAVNLLGSIRDRNADGDNALIKLDGGLDVNGNGHVDFVTPGSTSYGFENFTGTKSAGYFNSNGNGTYGQTINTSGLNEGYHYLTVRVFRHRDDGGPSVYQDFKEVLYVDRLKPVSAVDSFHAYDAAGGNDIWIKSTDQTANSVHTYLNLPSTVTDAQILAMVNNGQGGTDQIDRDVFKTGFGSMPNGNNVVTIVTYEIDGNYNIQRVVGVNGANGNSVGKGIGDLNHDGAIDSNDLAGTGYGFEHVLYTKNAEFNASADVNADGLVDSRDLFSLDNVLSGATSGVKVSLRQVEVRRGNINGAFGTDAYDIDAEYQSIGKTGDVWTPDLNVDGKVDQGDVDLLVRQILQTQYGDVNLDGKVDINDLYALKPYYLKSGQGWAQGDITGDGTVNASDLALVGQYFNFGVDSVNQITFAQAENLSGVPEPSLLGTAGISGFLALRRWGRKQSKNFFCGGKL